MGSIYKRGNIYWIKYHRRGKPHRESTRSEKESDAKRLLKKREGEIAEGKLPGVYLDKVLFDDLAKDLLTDHELSKRKSMERTKISIAHLEKVFAGVKVVNIDSSRIKEYIDMRRNDSIESATINRELDALKRMFSLGAECSPPKVHTIPHIPKLKGNPPRKGFVECGDFLALREKLPDYLKDFCTFAYRTGWRKSEITKMKWDQVNLSQETVTLNAGETKNDEARIVYLDNELKGIFERQLEARKHGQKILPYVFLNEDKTDRIKSFRKAWISACIKAGFWAWDEEKKIKVSLKIFHDFRRSAVRNLVRSGIPEGVAMKISGHKTRSVFERYNIVSDSDLKMAAQKQEAYLQTQMGTISGTIDNFEDKKEAAEAAKSLNSMVGMARFERATPASRTQCPTKLGHIPTSGDDIEFISNCPPFLFSQHSNSII